MQQQSVSLQQRYQRIHACPSSWHTRSSRSNTSIKQHWHTDEQQHHVHVQHVTMQISGHTLRSSPELTHGGQLQSVITLFWQYAAALNSTQTAATLTSKGIAYIVSMHLSAGMKPYNCFGWRGRLGSIGGFRVAPARRGQRCRWRWKECYKMIRSTRQRSKRMRRRS